MVIIDSLTAKAKLFVKGHPCQIFDADSNWISFWLFKIFTGNEDKKIRKSRFGQGWLPAFTAIMVSLVLASCVGVPVSSIIDKSDSEACLYIGKRDGVSLGQNLDVYEVKRMGPPKRSFFTRERVGRLVITKIIDGDFAKAALVWGKAEKTDVAEFSRPLRKASCCQS